MFPGGDGKRPQAEQVCIMCVMILQSVNVGYISGRNNAERFGIGIVGPCAVFGVWFAMAAAVNFFVGPEHGICIFFYHSRKVVRHCFPPLSNFIYWYNGDFVVQAALSGEIYRQYIKEECQDIHEVMLKYSEYPDLYK